ncbi:MAG: DNA polymerase III subunit gamma/tau [Rhodothermales bacterium]|nr:DNA polymerase III subunit gamma/tau [Rhodothermales bacterium]MBO6779189.1 DNA polymerase III subunit gamma/tau [Rhodothermales bacterium]
MPDTRFLVTARKYRPQLFGELVAQEHVTETLKNAIRLDRLAQAYLFTGPRGVGKTTAARILAKAVNCTTAQEERTDSAEPCRECESCRSFEEGRNLNIIEIDAASNNKVDDIRDLRETVRIPPQGNRKKVYIVDEVHMLTTQAFNALLKTLEEPPAHALFIFATTEPHKVLPTIQSRCQRFDFRRIPVQEIVSRLAEICTSEGISADDGSLMLIARKGDGALRDALSVFDQAVSLCGDDLQQDRLVEALGVVSEELFFEVTTHIAHRDTAGMLALVDRVVSSGYDLQEFLDGLAEHLRNLLVARTMPDTDLIEAAEATRQRYARDAQSLTETQILRLLSTIDRTLDGLRVARQPRLRLELALVRMASMPATTDLREALELVKKMARDAGLPAPSDAPLAEAPVARPVESTTPAAAKPEPAATSGSVAKPRAPKPVAVEAAAAETPAETAQQEPEPEPAATSAAPQDQPTARPAQPKPAAAEPEQAAETPPPPEPFEPALRSEPAPSPSPAPQRPSPAQPALFNQGGGGSMDIFGAPALSRPALDRPDEKAQADVAVMEAPAAVGESVEEWEAVVEKVRTAKIHLGALLQHAQAEIRDATTVTLVVPDEFHARVLREAHDEIIQGLAEIGRPEVQRIDFEINGTVRHEEDVTVSDVDPQEALRKICEEYPAMKLLMERFGGEIVW